MNPRLFNDPGQAIDQLGRALRYQGQKCDGNQWQGITAPAPMLELFGPGFRSRIIYLDRIQPNLPWADQHFDERVSRIPSNPGEAYKIWPFYPKNDLDHQFRSEGEFTHTYQERIWPKFAGHGNEFNQRIQSGETLTLKNPHRGIRFEYGDLDDVVELLWRDPLTRQAYLPIWFPEDTGAKHHGRVPCSLGYQFIQRNGYMNCIYSIRSCDYFRHLRDDVYLACKLLIWIINELSNHCRQYECVKFDWRSVHPGVLDMHIGSLHCWLSERDLLPK